MYNAKCYSVLILYYARYCPRERNKIVSNLLLNFSSTNYAPNTSRVKKVFVKMAQIYFIFVDRLTDDKGQKTRA